MKSLRKIYTISLFFVLLRAAPSQEAPDKTRSLEVFVDNELHTLINKIDSSLKGLEDELSGLKQKLWHGTEDLESILNRYRASLYLRLHCEKPEHSSSSCALVTSEAPLIQEHTILSARRKKVQGALNLFLNKNLTEDEVPVIAYCGSGGGIRAQYGTLGWLKAAENLHLLDTIQLASGLSGSTWALNPWVTSQLSVKDYSAQLVPRLSKTLREHLNNLTDQDKKELLSMLAKSHFDKRAISAVDLYGWFLGYLFLKDLPGITSFSSVQLSSLRSPIETGKFPLIISTSILGSNERIRSLYGSSPTFETNPFFSGSFEARIFMPTWSLGRLFNQGQTIPFIPQSLFPEVTLVEDAGQKIAPATTQCLEAIAHLVEYLAYHDYFGRELPLAYLMGICGSAFSIDLQNILLEIVTTLFTTSPTQEKEVSLLLSIFQELLSTELGALVAQMSNGLIPADETTDALNNDQLGAAYLANPAFNLEGNPLKDQKETALVDAGLGIIGLDRCNIGIMPLLHRNVDCIIICDSSAAEISSLRAAEMLAKQAQLPFPEIPYDRVLTQEMTLMCDEKNLYAPVVIYIPVIASKSYSKKLGHDFDPHGPPYQTLNFCYTTQDAEDLMGLVEYVVETHLDLIKEGFTRAIARKKARNLAYTSTHEL